MPLFYCFNIFLGAFLLFSIQPIIAKIILPELGGSPAVWQTTMVFFQALLLAGYAYTHYIARNLPSKWQIYLHRALILISILWLPIVLKTDLWLDRNDTPIGWLFLCLLFTISFPFLLLSTTNPLLQSWFAKTEKNQNPYFLYVFSNIGSLLALLSYPILIEPFLTTDMQSSIWGILYIIYSLLIIALSIYARKLIDDNTISKESVLSKKISYSQKLTWLGYSFIPSSLMLGVTTYITTDIVAIPLLWIIPLALYLLSFILVFSRKSYGYKFSEKYFLCAIIASIALFHNITFLTVLIHIVTFFLLCMVCHGRLNEQKPEKYYLTEFYLWLSIGGVLGGIFNALIAPILFKTVIEYPLLLLICVSLSGSRFLIKNIKNVYLAIIVLSIALTIQISPDLCKTLAEPLYNNIQNYINFNYIVIFLTIILGVIIAKHNSLFLLLFLSACFISDILDLINNHSLFIERNFFGVSRVYKGDKNMLVYKHGTTIHGMQYSLEIKNPNPQTYYKTPIKELFSIINPITKEPFAIVGLGVGTISHYADKGQMFDIYEIDPNVIKIATNTKYFTFLQKSKGQKNIILGDARLKLQEAKDKKYGLMFMDAYSSDSLPAHLLTKEAVDIYLNKLEDKGILAFHITNRHLNLEPVLKSLASYNHMEIYKRHHIPSNKQLKNNTYIAESTWVILTKNKKFIRQLIEQYPEWEALKTDREIMWHDNFSSIFPILKR